MKIAKYLFLLLLLFSATVSIFVATKDGSYTIKKEKTISVPREIVYKYITDKKNWDSINPWQGENVVITKSELVPNESISQSIVLNQTTNQLQLELKDTLKNKTIATWSTSGTQTFKDKLFSIIGRGSKNDFDDRFEKGLSFINKTLTREINTFEIKLNGFAKRDTIFYIQIPVVSSKEQIPYYIKKNLPKLQQILTSTETPTNGDPFIIYHAKDSVANKFKYSIAIPLKEKIYTSPDSDIINGQINPTGYAKVIVKGNYIHLNEAYQKLSAYMRENKLQRTYRFKEIEIISKNSLTEKSASNWKTEINIAARPIKVVEKPKVIKKDSTNTTVTKAVETKKTV